jgi:predicted metal-binding membrane protein
METENVEDPLRSMRPGIVPLIAATLVAAVTILCWIWIVPMARDMYGPMTGPSAWMMRPTWDARYTALIWLMWAVMMAAMMLPSAAPIVLLYARVGPPRGRPALRVAALIAGYLGVWSAFSAAATAIQRLLSMSLLVTPMMEMASRRGAGILLVLAGAYQFTPAKIACLRACRSPMSYVMRRTGAGAGGALLLGLEHGAYCLGCCWALMLLLFAGGVMNLSVIVGLTAVVLLEKAAPFGEQTSRAIGVALLVLGAWSLWP